MALIGSRAMSRKPKGSWEGYQHGATSWVQQNGTGYDRSQKAVRNRHLNKVTPGKAEPFRASNGPMNRIVDTTRGRSGSSSSMINKFLKAKKVF